MEKRSINEEEREFKQEQIIFSGYEYIKYTRCTFYADVHMKATVEGEVEFIDCIFKGNSRFFIEGGEYKNDFTLNFNELYELQIFGGKFTNFHLGKWGSGSKIDGIYIYHIEKIEGKIQFSRVQSNALHISGQNENTQFAFEDSKFTRVNVYRLNNKSTLRFQNIGSTGLKGSEFNIQDSNLGTSDFFLVDFDSFQEVNIRSSFIANSIFIDCKLLNPIQAKVGSGVSKGEIDMVSLNINNSETSLKQHSDEEFLNIFEFTKEEQNKKLLEYKKQLKTLEEADVQQQIGYRKENYKQLKYSFYKTGDRISEKLFHGREMEEFMKMDIPLSDKLILKFSKWSSDFGQSVSRPFWVNGGIHVLLCVFLFGVLNYQGYYFTLKTPSWCAFRSAMNEGLYLFLPLKAFNKDILLFDVIMKINSGFFIYNILRASRKFYH